jgi:hypothetical protein
MLLIILIIGKDSCDAHDRHRTASYRELFCRTSPDGAKKIFNKERDPLAIMALPMILLEKDFSDTGRRG